MQYCFAALIFLGLSTTIAAQIPDCAKDCIDRATIKQGCTVGDLVCSCTTKNFDAIEADSGTCVVTACGSDKAQKEVLLAALALCAGQPVSTTSSSKVSPTLEPDEADSPYGSDDGHGSSYTDATTIAAASTTSAGPSTTATPTRSSGHPASNSTLPSLIPYSDAANPVVPLRGVLAVCLSALILS